ncbi:MAG: bifunctional folylpolyglutamate synthase/dihydrofolate synthase [Chloroflexota bacterium]
MNYDEALSYIHGFQRFGSTPGLQRINAILAELGHPERRLRFVHIAGTNGKGSVTAMVDAALRAAGCRCGRYISPYLERFNERIGFGGRDISDDDLCAVIDEVRAAVERAMAAGAERPTEFDVTTAVAFQYYARVGAEYVALEVGLGGRYDSTNVVDPAVSVITSIGYDHVAVLGPTLRDIAANKAGIIKPGRPVVARCADADALAVIAAEARRQGSPLTVVGQDVTWDGQLADDRLGPLGGQTVAVRSADWQLADIHVPLAGPHQCENTATAVAALKLLADQGAALSDAEIRHGIAATVWPGRLEVLSQRPMVVIDGAHNPQAAAALAVAVGPVRRRRTILVLGMLADKDIGPVLDSLVPLADEIIVTTPASVRASAPEAVATEVARRAANVRAIADAHAAVAEALTVAQADDLVLVTGSLYLIGDVRPVLRRLLAAEASSQRGRRPGEGFPRHR